ncbi:MAG TPA: hypothetical protein VGW09_04050 [Nitrososphaeraceae archaeon]|nr:hypothetical protein [Nitrososphaeraceae archaeon]
MKTTTFSKRLVQKKVLIPAILVVGIMLSAIFILSSLFDNTWAQQQQQPLLRGFNKTSDMSEYAEMPKVNGSVNVRDGIKNFFAENAKTPFIMGAQTAQDQIANGTVLGGHIGVTQGYLTYTYFVMNPTNDTAHKVIVDAGNGQVLHTSESKQIGSGAQSMFESFGQGREHKGFGGGGGFGPFGHGFGPFGGFWHNK